MEFVLVKVQKNICHKLLRRLATVGSLFLGVISILPIVAKDVSDFQKQLLLEESSLLIIISTGIEGIKQLEGYLLKRKYVGFYGYNRIK